MSPLWPLVWTVCGLSVGLPCVYGASVSPILLRTTSATPPEDQPNTTDITDTPSSNDTGLSCVSLLPPRRGSYYVERGTGVSVGTVLVFWCKEGYQLVGSEKITCMVQVGVPHWSNYLPVCESIPKPDDQGLRVAVLVSVVSGIVILTMSVSFIVCCVQERLSKRRESRRSGRSRRREKRRPTLRRSPSWLEREEGDWEAFPPPKIYNLSQQLDPQVPPGSPLSAAPVRGCENRGYERSQESLLRSPLTGVCPLESQIYPHLVLQRVPTISTPTATTTTSTNTPVYLHISAPPSAKATRVPPLTPP